MERVMLSWIAVFMTTAIAAFAGYEYEGKWGSTGSGPGQFNSPWGVALAPNGNVYVTDADNHRVQYFTATGSYLGRWEVGPCYDLAVGSNGNVFVVSGEDIKRYSPQGSFIGSWNSQCSVPVGIGIAPNDDIYVTDDWGGFASFTATGSYRGYWGTYYLSSPLDVAIGANDVVYVTSSGVDAIIYFSTWGTHLGHWGSSGSGNGEFNYPCGIDISDDGKIFVVDVGNHRVQYFTLRGSFLGKWGSEGSGNGQFIGARGIALRPTASRGYVMDRSQDRVQYFNRNEPAVFPASLGRVKAVFK